MKINWKVFFKSLGSAAISGAITGVTAYATLPHDPGSPSGIKGMLVIGGVGALTGVVNYLKQSPLLKGE